MKKLYTSCYALNYRNPNAIGISFILPSNFDGKSMAKLAPTVGMISKIKSWVQEGEYSEKEYVENYINILEERGITAQGLVDELPDGAILLCYEMPGEFCHRRVLADWIYNETGVLVEEAKSYKELKYEAKNKLVDNFVDF